MNKVQQEFLDLIKCNNKKDWIKDEEIAQLCAARVAKHAIKFAEFIDYHNLKTDGLNWYNKDGSVICALTSELFDLYIQSSALIKTE